MEERRPGDEAATAPREKVITSEKVRGSIVHTPAAWPGRNTSGYEPVDDKVLVLPDVVGIKTVGNIIIPGDPHEREQARIEYGRIVALGPEAFALSGDRVRVWKPENPKPQVGDRVFFQRYAGEFLDGLDDTQYRLMSDSAIGAVLRPVSEL